MKSINPATGETLKDYKEHSKNEVQLLLKKADLIFHDWKRTSFSQRSALFLRVSQLLKDQSSALAKIMTEEMGKPLSQAKAEVGKCAWVCEFYAENAASFLANQPITTEDSLSYISFQPLGVILGIMPWNFPFWQVFRYVAPTLMAGNTTVLKHASNVFGCELAIEDLFHKAGFPEGVFKSLLIDSKAVADVIKSPEIKAVTLTGSTAAGKSVAQSAAEVLKKAVLELGGSDAYVILSDADIDQAVEICLQGRFQNTGQSCIAAKRFIVVGAVREEFEKKLFLAIEDLTYGDPLQGKHMLGPLARHDLRDSLHEQVARSIDQGARCLIGGYIPEGPGAYYPATLLTDIKPGMAAYTEELFGPVACIIPAKDEKEALQFANDSIYGLGAAVLTRDLDKGQHIAEFELEAGCCFVNNFVRSDPRLPFGGIKESGYGRELGSFGIREFVNIKTIKVYTNKV